MFFKKRAQAAMEFLMTYGWAILVVLAAVGILAYLGVFNMDERIPSTCALNPTGQGLDCETTPFFDAANDQIEFTILNGNAWDAIDIRVEDGSADDSCVGGFVSPDDQFNMTRGETQVVRVDCVGLTSGERYDERFNIVYQDPNGQSHRVNAHISDIA